MELTHARRDLAFLFLQNPQLTGVENIAKGRTDEELIKLLNYCEGTLKRFSTEELVPFDAYPWGTVKDVAGDQERAEELDVPIAEFRKNWNKVYQALRSNLHDAILDEAFSRRITDCSSLMA